MRARQAEDDRNNLPRCTSCTYSSPAVIVRMRRRGHKQCPRALLTGPKGAFDKCAGWRRAFGQCRHAAPTNTTATARGLELLALADARLESQRTEIKARRGRTNKARARAREGNGEQRQDDSGTVKGSTFSANGRVDTYSKTRHSTQPFCVARFWGQSALDADQFMVSFRRSPGGHSVPGP